MLLNLRLIYNYNQTPFHFFLKKKSNKKAYKYKENNRKII